MLTVTRSWDYEATLLCEGWDVWIEAFEFCGSNVRETIVIDSVWIFVVCVLITCTFPFPTKKYARAFRIDAIISKFDSHNFDWHLSLSVPVTLLV